ncbi:aminopeptidase N [Amphiplicatus metriothermophilus]|uniref:Aminopeptidase N n=1 Tax=Amphiplicatus metriothermophilus TaxID=1519374 RepID=A0A239PT83_9PROT|nr:aminopeptidase N [Amphiplicatus metriothermophilus]MBB5519367.1 aminopeptidase N [Amphiplicatus metriothermophilus]SNT73485.1 aminopeptidase N [Amphiplicatus metriothermophilus]
MRDDAPPDAPAPRPVRLADYRPPAYLINRIELDFCLDPQRTIVASRLSVQKAPGTPAGAPLVLDGEKIELLSVALDGAPLPKDRYALDEKSLTLFDPPESFALAIRTACAPAANTALSGLYISNDMFCTQCEAEGFRRITYFLDRPDVLAKYAVRIEADQARYPVLLSNGNSVESGMLPEGRHFVRWEDPHPKPSYLFALVGGDLAAVEDSFITRSGRKVALKIFVQPQNADKCAYTLDCLKRAMRWDEETFGREYDLDIFMIVAVDHFNFGAMENKGLNIFNSAYVLASPETATDTDYEAIESIVAHEYFHNWSGNRVTCRDWFQLCLKEGFTVFRDQEFSADMRSRAVQRIKDVRRLWSQQFPEDAGPLAHPPRPETYITIDNFYTATVYEKGAEIVRMVKTLLRHEKFRSACDLYFERHDGEAATVEDFVRAMEDGGGIDLRQFRRWYSDAGTPRVSVREHIAPSGAYALELAQKTDPTPGQSEKPPRHIPIAYALYGAESGRRLAEGVLEFKEETGHFDLGKFDERPIASLLTGFSAPVRLERSLSLDDRLFLAARDDDLFNRWAATEALWRDLCLAFAGAKEMESREAALSRFEEALFAAMGEADRDPALAAELLRCPSEADLARNVEIIEPTAIVRGRTYVREAVGAALKDRLLALYERLRPNRPFQPTAEQAGERALKNAALALLVAAGETSLALEQAKSANNMTDEAAATATLATSSGPERREALDRFYARWKADALVVNKWLAWNAMRPEPDGAQGDSSLDHVRRLTGHEAFDRRNPNKARSLLGVFARENLAGFHRLDGAGYRFFVDEILSIDALNPQLAARLIAALDNWRRLEPHRRAQAERELRRLANAKGISPNLYEMAARLLA